MNEYTYAEQSKGLTFEQVVSLGQNAKVVIEGPFGNIPHLIGVAADLLLVDLAERKGWPVYEANR